MNARAPACHADVLMPTTTPHTASERIAWIDVCKGLSMVGIVLCHNGPLMELFPLLHNFLFAFVVPTFFFTTGLTLRVSAGLQALERAASALGSYVVLSMLVVPYTLMGNPSARLLDVLAGVAYGTGHTMALAPFWFMTCLAACLIVSHFVFAGLRLVRITPSRPLVLGLGLLLVLVGGFSVASRDYSLHASLSWGSVSASGMVWSLDLVPMALGFLWVGQATSAQAVRELIQRFPWRAGGSAILLLAIILGALSNFSIHTDLNMRSFHPPLPAFAMAWCGIAMIAIVATLVSFWGPLSRALSTVGQASLIILWLHNAAQNAVHKKLLVSTSWTLMAIGLTAFAASLLLPLIFDRLVVQRVALLRRLVFPRFKFSPRPTQ